ncbi:PucR family transcriptional regulator [Neobacillus bataviensis LMG 21833]|uniref:PucR family transcriptional regulator n=1 Tax=Neobacillus bataviensis LMG 21833 TaxID=1117379 RepID=K6DYF7_9BACI|nr:V4R domain-containing protein [Neobacillus bataviensis]EKN65906.1 PucR family transcriptional regulator [Neobacillus bataviensis LMG 21833]
MRISFSEHNYNHNLPVYGRKIVTSSTALGILREQLAKNIGIERIKGFLIRFGWELGVNDAKEIMQTNQSIDYLIKNGPILHGENGHFLGTEYEGYAELDEDQNLISTQGSGIWIDSYEALEHIKQLGLSAAPVCHTLVGYSSGFMSTVCGKPVIVKEVSCIGKGDKECRWIVRTQKEWEDEGGDEWDIFNETPIVKELEYTYEQLLEQKNLITRLADFQKRLTEEIASGGDLQSIANTVEKIVHLPTMIDDIDFRTISYSGVSSEVFKELTADIQHFYIDEHVSTLSRREKQQLPFRNKTIKTTIQERLIAPILVQKEVIGYCAFIYDGVKKSKSEEDYLFLERFANAASLILLNEKTRFESFERMKGNFLEQLLDGHLPENEILSRGKYTGLDLGRPYVIAVMDHKKSQISFEEEFRLHEQILEATFRFFSKKNQNILAGQRENTIVLLISTETMTTSMIYNSIKEFHLDLQKNYPKMEFKLGISSAGDEIKEIQDYYEEAVMALRLNKKMNLVFFDSLGIMGVMINSKNKDKIYKLAKKALGPLYDFKDPKNLELLKTLYYFLLNGGNLKLTTHDLSLSMSGLRHRLEKIEILVEKDLRDPNQNHQLLTIVKSLIALGELEIE